MTSDMPFSFWIEALEFLSLMCEIAAVISGFLDMPELSNEFVKGAYVCAAAIIGIGRKLGEQ